MSTPRLVHLNDAVLICTCFGFGPSLRAIPGAKSRGILRSLKQKIFVDPYELLRQFFKALGLRRMPKWSDGRITDDGEVIAAAVANIKAQALSIGGEGLAVQLHNLPKTGRVQWREHLADSAQIR
jgi:hypothetical protein